jgi:hypothetical protein
MMCLYWSCLEFDYAGKMEGGGKIEAALRCLNNGRHCVISTSAAEAALSYAQHAQAGLRVHPRWVYDPTLPVWGGSPLDMLAW